MAGKIRDEDVATVRERARIDQIVGEFVQLKSAGGGSLKGLCPFHEERSPSFHVTPAKSLYYCFGCGEGGDVIGFLRKIDHLTFAEAVEKLAAKTGVTLRYVEGSAVPSRQQSQRTRLVAANAAAAAYFVEQLATAEAEAGRKFLTERGFEAAAAADFGVGYAPKGWDKLTAFLRAKGFNDQEILAAGLVAQGERGIYDRFRGRLVWPIRDASGDVVGFGARKLYDDDQGPKYLNTPETSIYKKSQVLYGIDVARREIAKQQQAVVVEGYTDVMAAHLSGVTTAVATCGTAFGSDHIQVLRRLLMDQNQFQGHVIFTFDGDAAGQKAALRAFDEDQKFVAQTFVAVEPSGMDPCELRMARGPEAVRELIDRRVPLFEFAIKATLRQFDLDRAEGRIGALREAAPVIARIRDEALRPEYARLLSGWLGMEPREVLAAVAAVSGSKGAHSRPRTQAPQRNFASPGSMQTEPSSDSASAARRSSGSGSGSGNATNSSSARVAGGAPGESAGDSVGRWSADIEALTRHNPRDPILQVQRSALRCILQAPVLVGATFDAIETTAFTFPAYREVFTACTKALTEWGDLSQITDEPAWITAVLASCPDDIVRRVVMELTVEPMPVDAVDDRYVDSLLARLREVDAGRRLEELRGQLQRLEGTDEAQKSADVFRELLDLENKRRALGDQARGEL